MFCEVNGVMRASMVQKTKGPKFNIGKFDGVSGEVAQGEGNKAAMRREWEQQTQIEWSNWIQFGTLQLNGDLSYKYTLFKAFCNTELDLPTKNDQKENVQWHALSTIFNHDMSQQYAINVPILVKHAIKGQGTISMKATY